MHSKVRIRKRQIERELLIAWGLVIIYVVTFTVFSIVRHNTLHTTNYDMGILSHVIWNTAHGRWFETSLDRSQDVELIGSYLGNHVRPIFLLLAPFYRLWPDPRQLLILQSIALGLGGICLYLVTRQKTESPPTALVVTLCYLLYPALGFINLFDFHPVAFTIPLLFLAYWAQSNERWPIFWIAIVLTLATKEEMVVPVGAWGLALVLRRKRRQTGILLAALAAVWALISFGVIIPHFQGRGYRFWEMWAHLPGFSQLLGGSTEATTPAANLSPNLMIIWLVHLFLPLGFFPFLGPNSFLAAIPCFFYLLLSNHPRTYTIGFQYPAVVIPWLFLATVEGMAWLRQTDRNYLHRLGLAAMITATLGTNLFANPIIRQAQNGSFRPAPQHEEMLAAMEIIPPDASVCTTSRLGPSLTDRRVIIDFEAHERFRLDHVTMADYILLDLVDCHVTAAPTGYRRARYAEMVTQVLETRLYRVLYWSDRVLLLERGAPSEERINAVQDYVDQLVEMDYPCWP